MQEAPRMSSLLKIVASTHRPDAPGRVNHRMGEVQSQRPCVEILGKGGIIMLECDVTLGRESTAGIWIIVTLGHKPCFSKVF